MPPSHGSQQFATVVPSGSVMFAVNRGDPTAFGLWTGIDHGRHLRCGGRIWGQERFNMDAYQINEVLEDHWTWLKTNGQEGMRADFASSNTRLRKAVQNRP